MNEDQLNEVMQSMSASRILVSVLDTVGPISVSTEKFMNANQYDRGLSVTYNDETLEFEFKLRDEENE